MACNFEILGYCAQHSAQKSSLDFLITPGRGITSVEQKKGRPKKARKKKAKTTHKKQEKKAESLNASHVVLKGHDEKSFHNCDVISPNYSLAAQGAVTLVVSGVVVVFLLLLL